MTLSPRPITPSTVSLPFDIKIPLLGKETKQSPTEPPIQPISTPERRSTSFSRPQLTAPSKAFNEYQLILAIENTQGHKKHLLDSFTKGISDNTQRAKELSIENLEKLKTEAENAKDKSFWNTLTTVAECFLAAFNTIFGASVVASGGGTLGGLMVFSGLFSLTKLAMDKSGSWSFLASQMASSREQQKKIEHYLPLAMGYISQTLSVAGTGACAIWSSMNYATQAKIIFEGALACYESTTQAGNAIATMKLEFTQADLLALDNQLNTIELQQQDTLSTIEQITSILKSCEQAAERVIALAANALKQTTLHA
jgi:hypothetical protein